MMKLMIPMILVLISGCVNVQQRDPVTVDNVKHAREVYERDSNADPIVKEAHGAWFDEWLEYEDEGKEDE